MRKGLLLGLVLMGMAAEASVDNLGSLIAEGYADQAKIYKQLQKAISETPTIQATQQGKLLEDLAVKSQSSEFKMHLVSSQ